MNNQIIKQNLISNPLLAYEIVIPSPETFTLTQYEQSAFPAIFGNLLNTSITNVYPMYRLGRVLSFDIKPVTRPDPLIIFSNTGDLKPYYSIWRKIVIQNVWIDNPFGVSIANQYDLAIRHFIETSLLTTHEICFAVLEMLKFKNTNILI